MSSATIKQLRTLFAGLERAHGSYTVDEEMSSDGKRNKVAGKALTLAKPVTDDLWKQHLDGKRGLGIVPIMDDGMCWWACIDVDSYKGDIPGECNAFIAEHGLPFVVCRSKSGGAHVFVFFKEPMHCKYVRTKLEHFATAMGYKGAEVFPKQNKLDLEKQEIGNWLNMPYFNSNDTDRFGYNSAGTRLPLETFLDYAMNNRVSHKGFTKLSPPDIHHPFEDGPPCLQALSRDKVAEGGRNNAMFQFGVYAKKRHGEDWEEKLYEYNSRFFDPPIPQREMRETIIKSFDRRDYGGYKCEEQPMASVCNRKECLKRRYGIGGEHREREAAEITGMMSNLRHVVYVDANGKPLVEGAYWLLNFQDSTLQLTTAQLQDSKKFASVVMDTVRMWPPTIPLHRWRELVMPLLDECQVIHLPYETSPVSVLVSALRRYIRFNIGAENLRDVHEGQTLRKEDAYYINPAHFLEDLENLRGAKADRKSVWKYLSGAGVDRHNSTFKTPDGNIHRITCWVVPIAMVDDVEPRDRIDDGVNF